MQYLIKLASHPRKIRRKFLSFSRSGVLVIDIVSNLSQGRGLVICHLCVQMYRDTLYSHLCTFDSNKRSISEYDNTIIPGQSVIINARLLTFNMLLKLNQATMTGHGTAIHCIGNPDAILRA